MDWAMSRDRYYYFYYFFPGRKSHIKVIRMLYGKIKIKTLKETNMGVAEALFDTQRRPIWVWAQALFDPLRRQKRPNFNTV